MVDFVRNILHNVLSNEYLFVLDNVSLDAIIQYLPWEDIVKTIRKGVREKYKHSKDAKEQWKKIWKNTNYGKYKDRNIGRYAIHHMLDSHGIRQELRPIIPSDCSLEFQLSEFHMSGYTQLIQLNLSTLFEHPAQMTQLIDDRVFTSRLCFVAKGIADDFWSKTIGKSALDKAMGCEPDYEMRYRPEIAVFHKGGDLIMVLSGVNIGVGFCNFCLRDAVQGHQMLHFEEQHMATYGITFYGRDINVSDICILLKSDKLEDKNPLCLFSGLQYQQQPYYNGNAHSHFDSRPQSQQWSQPMQYPAPALFGNNFEHTPSGYWPFRGPRNSAMNHRYNPMSYGQHNCNQPPYEPYRDNAHSNDNTANDDNMSIVSHQSSLYPIMYPFDDMMNESVSTFDTNGSMNPFH